MNEKEVLERLAPLVTEALGVDGSEVRVEAGLVEELGAESIDLLDLSFLIEREFGITIEPNEFEKAARERLPGGEYEKDGYLVPEALEELKKVLPEVSGERFAPGLRKADIPSLLTVGVFVHLIQRKTDERTGK